MTTTTPYSAEQAAKLARMMFGEELYFYRNEASFGQDELAALINAALSQQAAPGVAGEGFDNWLKEWQAKMGPLSKPGRAMARDAWNTAIAEAMPNFQHEKVMTASGQGYSQWRAPITDAETVASQPHPPEATALAQQVKEQAVEICNNSVLTAKSNQQSWVRNSTEEKAHEWQAQAILTKIAAIPIPEPRPDALVAMAYKKAAEAVRNVYEKKTQSPDEFGTLHDAALAVESLTPPAAQAALEELCMKVAEAVRDEALQCGLDRTFPHPELQAIVRATLNQH